MLLGSWVTNFRLCRYLFHRCQYCKTKLFMLSFKGINLHQKRKPRLFYAICDDKSAVGSTWYITYLTHVDHTSRKQATCGVSDFVHNAHLHHGWINSRLWSLELRRNESDGFPNHRRLDCLLSRLFRRRSKETPKLRVTGLCGGNSPVTGEFPAHRASNAGNASIWWRHHDLFAYLCL